MNSIIWQNDHKEDEFQFVVTRLLGLAILKYTVENTRKAQSFQVTFHVNQDGWQERGVPKESKEDFKNSIMKEWRKKLPLLPSPFTGTMVVHCHDLKIHMVAFNPKQ